jgi:ATP-binding cassette subfamily B protein
VSGTNETGTGEGADPKPPLRLARSVDELPPLTKADFFRFLAHLKPQLRLAAFMAAFLGIAVLAGLPVPLLLKWLVDDVLPHRDTGLLAILVALAVALPLIGATARIGQQYFQVRFRQGVSFSIRSGILRHTLSLPPAFFDGEDTGYLMSRVSGDAGQVEGLFSMTLFHSAFDAMKLVGGVIILFALNWKLALVASAVTPLYVVTVLVFRTKVRETSNDLMEAWGAYFKSIQETFAGIGLIKALGRAGPQAERVLDRVSGAFGPERRHAVLTAASSGATGLVTSLGMAAVMGLGAFEILEGRTTLGTVMSFIGYLGYLYGPARSLVDLPLRLQPSLVAFRRLLAILGLPPEPAGGIEPESVNGDLRFEDVTFAYPGRDPVLRGLTFSVRAGEKLGITGRTGAGKSTVLKLLLGFYAPASGRVTLDGIPVSDLSPQVLRSRLIPVPQGAFFFSDSVRANLSWAAPSAGEDEQRRALEECRALEFVERLPGGLDSLIGEGGRKLSGGERQRLAAARALLMKPDVLFMDEGTSDLDVDTEGELLENVLRALGNRTMVLVSHRPTALALMDRVLVLEDGRIAPS